MKKIAAIVAVTLVTCSVSACTNRNTSMRSPNTNPNTNLSVTQRDGNNYGTNNTGTQNGTRQYNAGATAYRDGVYVGEGNRGSDGNHIAIVTVSNGRISDVILKRTNAQGTEMYTGNATGNTSYNAGAGNTSNYIGGTTGNTTGNMGGTTGGTTGTGAGGVGTGITGGNAGGGTTGTGTSGTAGTGTTTGTTTGGTGSAGPNMGTTGGSTSGTISTNLDRVRRDLANSIVQQQTSNVILNDTGNDTASVNNWKVAVSRALDSARR